jgi:aminopeptidase N
MRRLPIAALMLLACSPLFAAARLPQNVLPDHYTLRIAPDLANETFTGEETIDVAVKEPSDTITLHAAELTLRDVTVEVGGKRLPATVTADAPNETVTLEVAQTIPPGRAAIHIAFDGKLSQQLRGLYLSKTAKRKYAVTQFEATSARRAFPCFDEPAMKAAFDITLVVDTGDTAISNAAIVSDTPAGPGKHAILFGTTKKISTYLVALLVGDFECISGQADGIPIRVCATPGLQQLGGFALGAAEACVTFFDQYYGIKYPFGKLDLVGIPDFAAGAMENVGAITFRETALLVDEKTASALARKRVADVVAHEIAHEWFGDLVTMQWWNDVWLNEGFATFMATKPIEAWKPEWREDLDRVTATAEALSIDSTKSTQAIRTNANVEGGGAFSNPGIIYGKTASVLRMVEEWIGPDTFRDAIRIYLRKYAWGNATAEDFWGTMKSATKQPVDTVLESFIDNTGAPLLQVAETCEEKGRAVTIAQERLLPRGDTAPATTWAIPLCAHSAGGGNEPCRLVTGAKESLLFPADCKRPLFLSRNGAGYFVADYPQDQRIAVRNDLQALPIQERMSFNANEWLLVKTMRLDIAEYLALLRVMPRGAERPLVTAIADNLIYLDRHLVNDSNRAAWQKFVRESLRGYAPFDWAPPPGETSEQRIARAWVLWALGYAADTEVVAGARAVAVQYMKDPASVDAVIADRALWVSATYGDEALFNRVLAQLEKEQTPEVAARYRNLLPLFRDPKLTARALEFIYSNRVRLQDFPVMAAAMFSDPITRPAAWAEAKKRWSEVDARTPGAMFRVAGATSSFCDPEAKKDVQAFVTEHPMRGGQSAVARVFDAIDACVAFRSAQQEAFDAGLGRAGQ